MTGTDDSDVLVHDLTIETTMCGAKSLDEAEEG